MRLYVNLDTQRLIEGPFFNNPVSSLSVPRSASVPLWVQFVSNGAVVDPETTTAAISSSSVAVATVITTSVAHGFSSGDTVVIVGHAGSTPSLDGAHVVTVLGPASFSVPVTVTAAGSSGTAVRTVDLALRFTAKTAGKFDEDPSMASLSAFTKSGSGTSTIFKGACNFITTGLNTLLGINPPATGDDQVQAELMAEFSWGGTDPGKVNWIEFFVRNDLYKTGEGAPATTGGANGETAIPSGASSVSVTFASPMASAGWHFLGAPVVINTTDGAPLGIFAVTMTARSANGFTVGLSAATDSGNYKLGWVVAV